MDGFVSTNRAAQRLGVTPQTVRRWAREQRLSGAVYHAKAWHIPESELDRSQLKRFAFGPEDDLHRAAALLVELSGRRISQRLAWHIEHLRGALDLHDQRLTATLDRASKVA